jgi:hypothetical protein
MWSRRFFFLASMGLVLSLTSLAQQAQPVPEKSGTVVVNDGFVQKQFGEGFKLLPGYAPMIADFDGDGVEDIAIAVTAKNPMMEASEHNFKVLDPYYGFFGVGDPKITTTFASADPATTACLLAIIHGIGHEAWHAENPKAKFVIVNLPFKQLAMRKLQVRKKSVSAIYALESGSAEMTSVVYFDGHKYKYEPLGAALH